MSLSSHSWEKIWSDMIWLLIVIQWRFTTTALLNTLDHSYHSGFPSSSKLSERNIQEKTSGSFQLQNYLQPPHWGVSWLHFGVKLDSYVASGLMNVTRILPSSSFHAIFRQQPFYFLYFLLQSGPKLRWFGWPIITPTYTIRISSFYEQ